MERLSSYAASEAVEASADLDDLDFDLAKELGFDLETQDDTLAELQEKFGERVFHYGPYSGTVSDMANSCPAFGTELEQGTAAATAWLESHDEPQTIQEPEDEPEDEPIIESAAELKNELEKTTDAAQEPGESPEGKTSVAEETVSIEKTGGVEPEPEKAQMPQPTEKPGADVVEPQAIEIKSVEADSDGLIEKLPEPAPETPLPSPIAEIEPAPVRNEVKPAPVRLPAEASELTADTEEPDEVEIFHIPSEDAEPEEEPVHEEVSELEEFYWPVRELEESRAISEIEEDLEAEEIQNDADEPPLGALEVAVETDQLESLEIVEDEEQIGAEPVETEEITPQATIIEQVLANEEQEQEPEPDSEAPEITELTSLSAPEVAAIIIELVGEQPARTAEQEPVIIRRQVELVTQKIEVLEQAKTAEECDEALQELRQELAGMLFLAGYANAAEIAERLTKQYDTKTLRSYINMLIRALTSPERMMADGSNTKAVASHHKCGSHVVQMVVRLIAPASELTAA